MPAAQILYMSRPVEQRARWPTDWPTAPAALWRHAGALRARPAVRRCAQAASRAPAAPPPPHRSHWRSSATRAQTARRRARAPAADAQPCVRQAACDVRKTAASATAPVWQQTPRLTAGARAPPPAGAPMRAMRRRRRCRRSRRGLRAAPHSWPSSKRACVPPKRRRCGRPIGRPPRRSTPRCVPSSPTGSHTPSALHVCRSLCRASPISAAYSTLAIARSYARCSTGRDMYNICSVGTSLLLLCLWRGFQPACPLSGAIDIDQKTTQGETQLRLHRHSTRRCPTALAAAVRCSRPSPAANSIRKCGLGVVRSRAPSDVKPRR